jgi:hypothetical protein
VSVGPAPASRHDTEPIADHRRGDREPTRCPRRRAVRRLPVLALRAPRPLQGRGRGRLRVPLPTPPQRPDHDPDRDRRPDPRVPGETDHRRPGRRGRHHRLAPRAPPRRDRLASHDLALPQSARASDPGAEEETQVLLHPLPGRHDAQPDLAERFHPLPTPSTRRPTRRRHRDPDLARRLLPLRTLRDRPPPGHRPDRALHVPANRCRARDSRLHAHRQRHGLHHPAVPRQERSRHPQRLRDRTPTPRHRPEELHPGPPHHQPSWSNASSRP